LRVGDVLEWLAAAALVAAAYLWHHQPAPAFLAAFLVLAYLAQSYGATPIRLPKLRRKPKP
jgi:hypothetical protein